MTDSLKTQLLAATSTTELDNLIAKAATFVYASPKTLRKWERVYKARFAVLANSK